jgi:hypothetical protein
LKFLPSRRGQGLDQPPAVVAGRRTRAMPRIDLRAIGRQMTFVAPFVR